MGPNTCYAIGNILTLFLRWEDQVNKNFCNVNVMNKAKNSPC